MFLHINNTMESLLKTTSVRVSSIRIMQVRVQNKGKSVWKSRYDGDVSCTTAAVGISLRYETKVIKLENQATQRKQYLHTDSKSLQPDVLKGLSIPSGVRRLKIGKGREVNL